MESWIWRIGREFGYTPARFLQAIGCPSTDRKDPAQRLTQAHVPYLATLARLSAHDLAEMAIIPPDWRLRAIFDVPFCGRCWIESQRLQGFAYLQGAWMHSGRISCPHHGNWLFSVRDKLGRAWTPELPELPMRLCVNPDERRNALWITMALIAADHPAMPGTGCPVDRLTRQRQIFNGQNPAGLSWLLSRMQLWPDAYRDACWVAWEELLLPPPVSSCAAVS